MPEEINEKLSQFLDNELDQQQALSLLVKIRQDSGLKNKIARYQLIKQALKSDGGLLIKTDLLDKVQQQIAQEPVVLVPVKRRRDQGVINWRMTSLAVAASLALVAVLAPRVINETGGNNGAQMVLAQQDTPTVESAEDQVPVMHPVPVDPKMKYYLQAHSNSVYTIGASNYQPYARLAGFSQGR